MFIFEEGQKFRLFGFVKWLVICNDPLSTEYRMRWEGWSSRILAYKFENPEVHRTLRDSEGQSP
jgi:hypothetical protein